MTTPASTAPSERIVPAVDALVDTLHDKIDVIDELEALYERQLDALRTNDADTLDTLATETQDCTATLDDMRRKSERQARLLGRVLDVEPDDPSLGTLIDALDDRASEELGRRLAEARTAVAERMQTVQQRRETLRLALEYAAELNHELLMAMQGATAEDDGQTYTAEGQPESRQLPEERSFVNTIG